MASEKRRGGEEERGKRWMEAIAAVLGAVLAIGTIGIIIWDGFSGSGRPPSIVVQALDVQEDGSGYLLEVSVTNTGGEAAAQVVIEGTLSRNGEVVETGEATFDYVAEDSTRRGGLFFSADPRTLDVSLRAKGFADP